MRKTDGKMKSVGGSKDISECRNLKSDEPIKEVSVKVVINGSESLISLNDFKELLFKEPVKARKTNISSIGNILNDKELLSTYGRAMIEEFVDYWTEMMPNGRKERWQKQKAFDIIRRLKAWAKRDYNSLYKEHKVQMEKARQDEYLRRKKEEAESFMPPEEQKRELKKLFSSFGKSRR